jgi:hypothetical protein
MHEPVMHRHGPVGEHLLPDETDQGMDALQHLQPLLHVGCLPTQHMGHHRGVELGALHAGGGQ